MPRTGPERRRFTREEKVRFVTEAERPGQLPLAVSALSQQTWVEDYRLPPPLALPFGTARSGWPALPPAAEFVVMVSAR